MEVPHAEQNGEEAGQTTPRGSMRPKPIVADFTMEQKEEFHEAFMNFSDEEGNLDIPALGHLLEALGEDLTENQVEAMFREVDEDGSGEVDFDEFISMMRRRLLTCQDTELDIRSAFNLLDKDGSGRIDKEESFRLCVFMLIDCPHPHPHPAHS